MLAYLPSVSKPSSLAAQIRDAERQVSKRQRALKVRAATLARKICQQMTAPASLLLAGGIGFVIGELTQRQNPKCRDSAGNPRAAVSTPLLAALNLITSTHALYTNLAPLVRAMKPFNPPTASGPVPPDVDYSI